MNLSFQLNWSSQEPPTTCVLGMDPNAADQDWPIVILLHGTHGNVNDMAFPAEHPGCNYNFGPVNQGRIDRGWHWYPAMLVWGIDADAPLTVTGWQKFLNDQQIPSVNYAQVDRDGPLDRPVTQLTALVDERIARYPHRKLAFITHSRGGILLRKFLTSGVNGLEGRIAGVLMLHSPNLGSQLANDAIQADQELTRLIHEVESASATLGVMLDLDDISKWVRDQVGAPAYHDYSVGSPLLQQLAQAEAAHPPQFPVHTFGGTSTRLTRVWVDWFTLDSSQLLIVDDDSGWHAGFHWFTEKGPLFDPIRWEPLQWVLDDVPGVSGMTPETTEHTGDIRVTDASARLPFAIAHHSNAINHAQALWDSNIQQQGLEALRTMRGHLATPELTARLAAGEYGSPLDNQQPYTLHISCTDSVTGQAVDAAVEIEGFPPAVANHPIPGIAYPSSKTWTSSWTEPGMSDGSNIDVCTVYTETHYPPCRLSHPNYRDVLISLGPNVQDGSAPRPRCLQFPANTPVQVVEGIRNWVIHHGGDPVPTESPVAGVDHQTWAGLHIQLTGMAQIGASSANLGRPAAPVIRLLHADGSARRATADSEKR